MEHGLRKSPRPETLRLLTEALHLDEAERARLFAVAHQAIEYGRAPGLTPPAATAIPLAIRPLPIPPDALIGRESDIAAIGTLMQEDEVRLITLTGPGGVGKTRLSLTVAERFQQQWYEGAAFVDLAPLADAEQIAPAIALALGLTLDSRSPANDTLAAVLRNRSLLLILDNMEHLLGGSAWIARLVADAQRLTVLVTSRVLLRIRGEYVYPVAPLAVPPAPDGHEVAPVAHLLQSPAVRLFRDRARQTGYGFDLDDGNAAAVAELCRRLDGLPLAIELAASRVGLLPPGSLLVRLQALSGGHRDGPARQQTLQQTIDWSYGLLDPASRIVYRRLSVFSGGFTLDAAEAVAGEHGMDVLGSIRTLLESSLLTRVPGAGAPRFSMLETIYRDMEARLDRSDEATAIRRRHAGWANSLVEAAGADLNFGRNSAGWSAILDAELGNLRRALAVLIESGDGDGAIHLISVGHLFFSDRLSPHEGARWIEAALPLARRASEPDRVIALSLLVVYATYLDDRAAAESARDQLKTWMRMTADPMAIGTACFMQGVFCQVNGLYPEAVSLHEQALAQFQEGEYPAWTILSLFEHGDCLLLSGSIDRARDVIEQGIALAREVGSTSELSYGLLYLGFAELTPGNLPAAAAGFAGGLDVALDHRIDRLSLGCITGMAGVARARGNPELAARLLGAVEEARRSSGIHLLPNQALIDEIAQLVRNDLGVERDRTLRREGARLTFAQAVDLAQGIALELARNLGAPSRAAAGGSQTGSDGFEN
jgi:predicted ATPase